jgi:3-keto-5-aminohexanoate cleavage enzyme
LPVNAVAIAQGIGVRVGLEDNIWWDTDRTRLATNCELLERVHALMQLQGHTLMTAKAFGEHGFYNAQRFSRV